VLPKKSPLLQPNSHHQLSNDCTKTTPTVSPPIPTRSLARHDIAEIAEFDDGHVGDVRGPVGGEEEDVDTGMCGIRLREQLRTRRSVTLSKEAFDKSAKKFVEKPAAPPPKVKIAIRMTIEVYDKYDPVMEGRLTNTFLEKMKTGNELAQPYVSVSTADIGVQAEILGVKHGNNLLFVADRFSGWRQVYPAPPGKFNGRFLRDNLASCNITEQPSKLNTKLPPAQTKRQTTTEPSTPPPAATSTTPTRSLSQSLPTPMRSLSRHGDPRLGFADIEELDDSVVDDVREQVDDREAAIVQDDGGGAVRDNDVQGPGGVEEVQRTRFDSSVKTRSRRQIRRAM
jgi:hypothetical protein